MKLRPLTAFALVFAAACANEAAKGDRNTGTALEGDAPAGVTLAPASAVGLDTAPATGPAIAPGTVDSADRARHHSPAHP